MKEDIEILQNYNDVFVWLAVLGMQDFFLFKQVVEDAMAFTAKNFNMTYEQVKALVGETKFRYSESELPIVVFFHEYLRKVRDSNK
ncbi:MAG: hypothetical protein KGJ59_09335 [Bacteroidota bacterium]|nr:hypothetical protein [Bacteroidota bacterium]